MIRVVNANGPPPVYEVTTEGPAPSPDEIAATEAEAKRFWSNVNHLSDHSAEYRTAHPGEFVVVAAGEAFFDATARGARAKALAAHPAESGAATVQYLLPPGGR